jgi:threonine/homoserine/homoserine lactone efflux protein
MTSLLLIFVFSSLVSFVGSLQLGPVNLFVIHTALAYGKKPAFYISLGGCIPEFIYCGSAVFANTYLLEYEGLVIFFKIMFILVLLILGLVLYLKRPSPISVNPVKITQKPIRYFFKGFALAAFNPQLLPFWLFVQVYFNSVKFLQIQSLHTKFSYILGAGFGAFLLLTFFIQMVLKYKHKVLNYLNNKYYFKGLSLFFFAAAGYQIWLLTHI